MIVDAIRHLSEGRDLPEMMASAAMEEIMTGEATPAQVGAFLMALKMKGETAPEIAGLARVMREKALRVESRWPDLLDTCGTGGDGMQTFNVSTGAAFIAAGAGAKVAKHGNRGMSKPSGSFDVLEALGIAVQLSPEQVKRCIDEIGIGFLFAQAFHPAMKHAGPVRRDIGVRTVFNLLGPLTNPAGAQYQVIGVPRRDLTVTLAEALLALGVTRAMVVHGEPGIGEFSTMGPTYVSEVRDGKIRRYTVSLEEVGLDPVTPDAIAGTSAAENAKTLTALLQGNEKGPKRDLLVLNAAAALVVAGLTENLKDGMNLAARTVESGAAWEKVETLQSIIPLPN
jgi:anthranilate phosphoribosyltransferase